MQKYWGWWLLSGVEAQISPFSFVITGLLKYYSEIFAHRLYSSKIKFFIVKNKFSYF